jgi:hypothetical protein
MGEVSGFEVVVPVEPEVALVLVVLTPWLPVAGMRTFLMKMVAIPAPWMTTS